MREEVRWFKDSIIYQILVDRFAGVNKSINPLRPDFCGGNIPVLEKRLDYLKKLGVNTLLLSPIYEGVTYHGYHITDFFVVDSRFGSMADFDNLVKRAHELGIKIIIDFVPNHVSVRHPFFVKAKTNQKSRYRNWFYFSKNNDYLSFLGYDEMPKLNLDNDSCRDYIVSAARFWLDRGVDGLRLDHVAGPSMKFWKYFSKELNKSHPPAILLGEMWLNEWNLKNWNTFKGAKNKLGRFLLKRKNELFIKDYIGILDGCLDFEFNQIIREYAQNKITHEIAYAKLQKHYSRFPKDFFLPTFLDNHDMERILFIANQDQETLKQLASWQFKIKQPTIIYYGTEIGMTQTSPSSSMKTHGDLLARQPMKWEDAGNEMFNFYKLLIAQKNRRERKDTENGTSGDVPTPNISLSGELIN